MNVTPIVTVIVPHHLDENHEYLKLCLDSILASEYENFEVICVADTKRPPLYLRNNLQGRLMIYWRPDLNTASAKINWAVEEAHPHSKYFWIVCDDVVVSKYAMKALVDGIGDNQVICNPMSNSDNGGQFFCDKMPPVKLSIEDFTTYEWAMDQYAMRRSFLIPVIAFISFYCTMIPRKVWEAVGELDARLDARHNDQDYCMRATKLRIQPLINLGAFALHFGDKTLPKCTTPAQLDECTRVFKEKWGI